MKRNRGTKAAEAKAAEAQAESTATQELDSLQTQVVVTEPPDTPSDADLIEGVRAPRPNRTIWVMVVVAVISLLAGIGVSQFIISPAQRAADAEPPDAGPVTVPVEMRQITTDITMRGDAVYDDATEVRIETGEIDGAAIVTGQVPEVGETVDVGNVLIEITGRPVLILPGELPVYRTLRIGSSGPDVAQLKAALLAQGISVGNADSDVYDANTATAVQALYTAAGYPAPSPDQEAVAELESAQQGLDAANLTLSEAQSTLEQASAGPTNLRQLELQQAIDSATSSLDQARATGDQAALVEAQNALDLAVAQREEEQSPDTSSEVAARDLAATQVRDAEEEVAQARAGTFTPFPASEVVYVASLPRRVDEVRVERGAAIDGVALTISGAQLEVVSNMPEADADLVSLEMSAFLDVDGTQVPATVTAIENDAASAASSSDSDDDSDSSERGDRTRVTVVPDELTDELRTELAGANVRVTIPLESTEGEVLAVPVAALTAGPGGESRVEVVRDDGESEVVVVETGLAAAGLVEIRSSEGQLEADNLVVVG
ncbi:MAG: hypothetical protein ACK5KU_10290 [Beutenbergiaceae bacterium]